MIFPLVVKEPGGSEAVRAYVFDCPGSEGERTWALSPSPRPDLFLPHPLSYSFGQKGGTGNTEAVVPVAYVAALPSAPSVSFLGKSHRSPVGVSQCLNGGGSSAFAYFVHTHTSFTFQTDRYVSLGDPRFS